jgi:hypothetical protein
LDKFLEKFTDRFIGFFTRSVAPSSIFFVLLFFNDKFFNCSEIYFQFICFVKELQSIDNILLYVILTILFLSYGYVNQIFSQILDNFIKNNYCLFSNFMFAKCCDGKFNFLRAKVKINLDKKEKAILDKIEFNDYNAYQVLGKDINVSSSYVDEVKSIHTFTVALLINFSIYSFYFELLDISKFLIFSIILILFFHYLSKSRYKARNKRLYINYLLKEDKPNKQEKEIKIKSIKVEIDE